MKSTEINALLALLGKCGYNDTNKAQFKRLSMRLLRELRKELGINADIRYNPAGVACSGDATLHGDDIYVSFNADFLDWILVRKCCGRKDYTGGHNQQYSFRQLREEGFSGLVNFVKKARQPSFVVN